jgi:hypothetical protein
MPKAIVEEMAGAQALQAERRELIKRLDDDPSALDRIDEIDRELAEIRTRRADR